MPGLLEVDQEQDDDKVALILNSIDEQKTKDQLISKLKQAGVTQPVLWGNKAGNKVSLYDECHAFGIPSLFVIDPKGRIVARNVKPLTEDGDAKEALSKLLEWMHQHPDAPLIEVTPTIKRANVDDRAFINLEVNNPFEASDHPIRVDIEGDGKKTLELLKGPQEIGMDGHVRDMGEYGKGFIMSIDVYHPAGVYLSTGRELHDVTNAPVSNAQLQEKQDERKLVKGSDSMTWKGDEREMPRIDNGFFFGMLLSRAASHYTRHRGVAPESVKELEESGLFPFAFVNPLTSNPLVSDNPVIQPGDCHMQVIDGEFVVRWNFSDGPVDASDPDYKTDADPTRITSLGIDLEHLKKRYDPKDQYALNDVETFLNGMLSYPVGDKNGIPMKIGSLDDFNVLGMDFSSSGLMIELIREPIYLVDPGQDSPNSKQCFVEAKFTSSEGEDQQPTMGKARVKLTWRYK